MDIYMEERMSTIFGKKKYDLRHRNMSWLLRDSFIGATRTDSPDIKRMKSNLARNIVIFVVVLVFLVMLLILNRLFV